jgi:hypothetical protein
MPPSQQSLASCNLFCAQIEDGLKYQKKLIATKSQAEIAFEDAALARLIFVASVEKPYYSAGSMLGVV